MDTKLVNKLDLNSFISGFASLFAREKSIEIQGDINYHIKFVQELLEHDTIKEPSPISNLDTQLLHISKQGILRLQEIYEFVKIFRYFEYLLGIDFKSNLNTWLHDIRIPRELIEISTYFDHKGAIKSSINERLSEIDADLKHTSDQIINHFSNILKSHNIQEYLVDTGVHYINDEETLLLRAGFKSAIKAKVISRSSSGFFYVIPQSVIKFKEHREDILLERESILYEYQKSISKTFYEQLLFLKFINKEFDRFDHYHARAIFARSRDLEFLMPSRENQHIVLKSFSHPAIKKPISIDVDFKGSSMFITGVNAGGKTMLLKSILASAYLSKIMIPQPLNASKSTMPYFKDIVAILDDPQSVKNDISTFAGRMVEFSKLFNQKNILIGVDEIELGTDADEAASLFKVMIESLQANNKIVITTHHKRLASLMAMDERVDMLAALYDEQNRRPTYKFLAGTIGKSYAFETALRYKIPYYVVEEAIKLHGEDKENLNDLIQKNIDLELKLKQKRKFLNKELTGANKLKNKLLNQKKQNQNEFKELIASYEQEYKKAINKAKEAINKTSTKDIHRQISKANKLKSGIRIIQKVKHPKTFEIGDSVKYNSTIGEIIQIDKNYATIQCDTMSLKVNIEDLDISHTKPKKIGSINYEKTPRAFIKLDIHGLRVEEAREKLDKFISDALLSGIEEVYIYHGIGSGILANFTKEFLSSHPKVISHEDAPMNMGGYSATLVKL